MNGGVRALAVFNDGGGPALYAGGQFTNAGGVGASFIAKWNGSSWSALGSGMNDWVYALTVFDDGGGPALYAGGWFTTAGGVSANYIAKWNGSTWSALASGMDNLVYALTVFDDGGGPALYAGGFFITAGGMSANNIAKWNGSSWSALGSGVSGGPFPGVRALTVFEDGGGPALYAGGDFTIAGGGVSAYLAQWTCCTPRPYGDIAPLGGDGTVDLNDILCVLDDFGDPAACAGNADIFPCDIDGLIDLNDILAVLDAFGNNNACPGPCL